MNTQRALAIATGLALANFAAAQNFSSSDDFSSIVPGNWSSDSPVNAGAFQVSGGVLNFTDSVHTNSSGGSSRIWALNSGSPLADWSVQVNFALPSATLASSQFTSWTLYLRDSADPNSNYFSVFLQRSYLVANPFVEASVATGSTTTAYSTQQTTGASFTASVRVTYTAATQTLTAGFDPLGGTAFTNFYSAQVGPSGNNWGMTGTDTFAAQLWANNMAFGGTTAAIGLGTFAADNFVTSGTAIPEPTTCASLFGLAALGLAVTRRRRAP